MAKPVCPHCKKELPTPDRESMGMALRRALASEKWRYFFGGLLSYDTFQGRWQSLSHEQREAYCQLALELVTMLTRARKRVIDAKGESVP